MKLSTFEEAENYLYRFIPKTTQHIFPGKFGLDRMKLLLKELGNPQARLKIIHVAGTSGKGSTAYLTSLLLKTHGFVTGLHISPFLIDIRETFQINNRLIPTREFVYYLNSLVPAIEKVSPSYFEIKTALAYYIFAEKKVDYAVIEVGMGGLYDATNTVYRKDKVCLITKLGLDHIEILGKTIEKIAFQKAMITQKGNQVFTVNRPTSILQKGTSAGEVIKKVVKKQGGRLTLITKGEHFKNIRLKNETTFDFSFENLKLKNLHLGLRGSYQAENATLALSATGYLSNRDEFSLDEKAIRQSLKDAHFNGRFDVRNINGKTVVLDGAHNPQKMKAFISSLKEIYHKSKFTFLVAFKKGKDYREMLKLIVPYASSIIVTSFRIDNQDIIHLAEEPAVIAKILDKLNFKNYILAKDIKLALFELMKNKGEKAVITGSLYLMSSVYPRLRLTDLTTYSNVI